MDSELTLRDYVLILRRWLLVMVLVFAAVVTAAAVWTGLQTRLYRSTATVLINQQNPAEILGDQSTQNTSTADRLAANEVALIESHVVRQVAEQALGFEADIDASARARTDLILISAVDPDPARAMLIAETYTQTYVDVRSQQYIEERRNLAERFGEEIAELDRQIEAASEADAARLQVLRDNLATESDRLAIAAEISPPASQIIEPAEIPLAPFSPRLWRNLVLGGMLGALLATASALLLESMDRSVRSREIIEALTPGVSSLGVVPVFKSNSDLVTLAKPDGAESEIFTTMRAALEFAAVDDSIKMLQITSAGPSAGKTTIAANLAVSMAQAGQTVAVVDGDLRRPRLHDIFGLDQVPGLTSAILGTETLNSSARELRLDNGRLRVYPSGPIPPGPAELLGSQRAGAVFEALKNTFDVLIIDSPPVLPVADAMVLSRLVDATVLIANARRTRRNDLARSFESLQQAGANVVGTVLNAASGETLDSYGYGYGYGYGTGTETNGMRRLFRRSSSRHAPRIAGTQTLQRGEVPKFEAARRIPTPGTASTEGDGAPNRRASDAIDDVSAAGSPAAASGPGNHAAGNHAAGNLAGAERRGGASLRSTANAGIVPTGNRSASESGSAQGAAPQPVVPPSPADSVVQAEHTGASPARPATSNSTTVGRAEWGDRVTVR